MAGAQDRSAGHERYRPDRRFPADAHLVEAELFVADIKASCAFFTNKLGFSVVFTYGEPPFYGQVKRDVARLNLRLVCEPVFVGDIREREQLLSASMTLGSAAEIRQLFRHSTSRPAWTSSRP